MGVQAEKPAVGLSEKESGELAERIQSRHGPRQLSAMAELKMGNPHYELIMVGLWAPIF